MKEQFQKKLLERLNNVVEIVHNDDGTTDIRKGNTVYKNCIMTGYSAPVTNETVVETVKFVLEK